MESDGHRVVRERWFAVPDAVGNDIDQIQWELVGPAVAIVFVYSGLQALRHTWWREFEYRKQQVLEARDTAKEASTRAKGAVLIAGQSARNVVLARGWSAPASEDPKAASTTADTLSDLPGEAPSPSSMSSL